MKVQEPKIFLNKILLSSQLKTLNYNTDDKVITIIIGHIAIQN